MGDKEPKKTIKVWDSGIRLFHWTLAVLFCLSAYSAFQDKFGIYADMHLNAGVATLMLVIWRILWGVVGSDTARFSQFVKSPTAGFAHIKQMVAGLPYKSIGHNPLGGLSVALMLVLLLAQAMMGLFASDGMIFSGPLSAEVTGSLSSDLTEWHALLGRILIGVVAFHVLVVVVYGVLKRVNLVWPMISGNVGTEPSTPAPTMKPGWMALLLFIAAGATVCLSVF